MLAIFCRIGWPSISHLCPSFSNVPFCVAQVIDDIMANPEGYYFRVGSGQVLPAVEKAVVKMRTGDVWQLSIPPELGFGKEGRKAR
jgi:hypothetical protein